MSLVVNTEAVKKHLAYVSTGTVAFVASMPLLSLIQKMEECTVVGQILRRESQMWFQKPADEIIDYMVYRRVFPLSSPPVPVQACGVIAIFTLLMLVAAVATVHLYRKAHQPPPSLWARTVKQVTG